MAILTIDDKRYDIEQLSEEAKAKLKSARFCESKIEQLEAELALVRTARAAYLQALPALLSDEALVTGEATTDVESKVVNSSSPNPAATTKH